MGMMAQREIDERRQKTVTRWFCDCGFRGQTVRKLIKNHDLLDEAYNQTDQQSELTPDQRRTLAELIKFIDQQENER